MRDPEMWFENTYNTIYGIRRTVSWPIFRLVGLFKLAIARAARMNDRLIWGTPSAAASRIVNTP